MQLTKEEQQRYSRHLNIAEFGLAEQLKLKGSKVLVIGAGGLGCPLLLYLASAGIGTIGIVEYDIIDLTNLQRQVLYQTSDIGKPKIDIAAERINAINPNIAVIKHPCRLSRQNARAIIADYDIVADGSDNFPTRYLVNDTCVLENKPLVYGSILRFEGQVTVFNYHTDNMPGPNYRDLFPTPPPEGLVPNCAEAGVLGVLPGIIGSMQANEVIKIASGVGETLSGRLFLFDALTFNSRMIKYKKRADFEITELIDYDDFCGIPKVASPEVSPQILIELIASNKAYYIIDVREADEYLIDNIGADNMPLSTLRHVMDDMELEGNVVVHCQTGKRSAQAILLMKEEFPDVEFQNLKGGINHWRRVLGNQNIT